MNVILQIIQWAHDHRTALLDLVGGAAGLSILIEATLGKLKAGIKLPFSNFVVQIDSKKLSFSLLHLSSALSALSIWYLTNMPSQSAAGLYAAIAIVAGFWHRFVVSGAYGKYVQPYLEFLAAQKTATVTNSPAANTMSPAVPYAVTSDSVVGLAKPFTLEEGK